MRPEWTHGALAERAELGSNILRVRQRTPAYQSGIGGHNGASRSAAKQNNICGPQDSGSDRCEAAAPDRRPLSRKHAEDTKRIADLAHVSNDRKDLEELAVHSRSAQDALACAPMKTVQLLP